MAPAIAELLLLAVAVDCVGMRDAILLPVIGIAGAPLAWAVTTDLAVLRIGCDLLAVIIRASLALASGVATDRLARLKLRWLK
jgi:hypothetical protein